MAKAVIFMGTLHHGVETASWATFAARALRALQISTVNAVSFYLPPSLSDVPGTTAVTETRIVARDNVLFPTLALHCTPVVTLALPSATNALLRWDSRPLSPRSEDRRLTVAVDFRASSPIELCRAMHSTRNQPLVSLVSACLIVLFYFLQLVSTCSPD